MERQPISDSGFSQHVQAQLQQASQQIPSNNQIWGRGRGKRRGRGSVPGHNDQSRTNHQYLNSNTPIYNETGTNLHSHGIPRSGQPQHMPNWNSPRSQSSSYNHPPRGLTVNAYPVNRNHYNNSRQYEGSQYSTGHLSSNPTPIYPRNMTNIPDAQDEERIRRQRITNQSDFLNRAHSQVCHQFELTREEQNNKEDFRLQLESLVKDTLSSQASNANTEQIKLKCYGSLANGFGLKGCDMDLLLFVPELAPRADDDTAQDSLKDLRLEIGRILEAGILAHGHGARLLTNTRVPILRVCESPNEELLENLRENRAVWDREQAPKLVVRSQIDDLEVMQPPDPRSSDMDELAKQLMSLNAAEVPLPTSPSREQNNLEFGLNSGIQCDINFSNYVAIYNTRLLRKYVRYDERVRQLGIFVKAWAKIRDINTPYHGTLSSYGYILMLLHYLMNVAKPPVIPNLQELARYEDQWNRGAEIPLFEGFDVRFLDDDEKLRNWKSKTEQNYESIGHLLRGFFWYYASATGFHWNKQIISIRTKGGVLTKIDKNWTEAKWSGNANKNVRLRYLLAIEDPFETEHNVGRTVGHNGIVAIRDEFRRAWSIISRIDKSNIGISKVETFLEPVEDRGDTLRKDQEFRRQKMKQMRQELEAQEKALKSEASLENTKPPSDNT